MTVRLSNQQTRPPFSSSKLKIVGTAILKAAGFRQAEVSFLFVSDRIMKNFNRRYKGNPGATDVLAFSQVEGKLCPMKERAVLGDVIISVDAARRQAPRYKNSFKKEFILYMVHGVLHLLGYDDEKPGPRKVMRCEEKRIMEKIHSHFPSLWP